ncbi:MAG: 30S ribosomal protein S13 [candidate division WS6 bacterium GW2011_GWA2_37_6]|uniref:Small ribosomal subunit protein uS13 n=1 Tax=candidate division WS6 bacterium GW2011_GWA2_37_6 TaxID=1619087 RepID=A0A0G0H151_9BACT|nr:MAG: 30S ribosomal protein S13 [candidate division WS6 bacterium GW2011_GWA2_37_6]
MARITGVEIPNEKRIDIALTYIHGIGRASAKKVLGLANIEPNIKVNKLNESQLSRLAQVIETNMKVEGELKQEVYRNIKRLKDIKSYRGLRHKLGLPVRGQRTRTNAVTRKGRNIAVGGLKHKLEKT